MPPFPGRNASFPWKKSQPPSRHPGRCRSPLQVPETPTPKSQAYAAQTNLSPGRVASAVVLFGRHVRFREAVVVSVITTSASKIPTSPPLSNSQSLFTLSCAWLQDTETTLIKFHISASPQSHLFPSTVSTHHLLTAGCEAVSHNCPHLSILTVTV